MELTLRDQKTMRRKMKIMEKRTHLPLMRGVQNSGNEGERDGLEFVHHSPPRQWQALMVDLMKVMWI